MKVLLFLGTWFVTCLGNADNGYQVGDYARDFELKNVNGKDVSLSDYSSAEGFIVVFTCNHCPFAKAYEERIIELDKKFAPKGYPVIAINPNDPSQEPEDSFENMKKRAKEKNYSFPYLVDPNQEIARDYGAERTPHVYVLQKKDSKFQVKYIGAIDDNARDANEASKTYVGDAVNALLAGKEVPVKTTRAVGCSIKWK